MERQILSPHHKSFPKSCFVELCNIEIFLLKNFLKQKCFSKSPFEEISPACDELWLLEEPQEYQDDEEHQHLERTIVYFFFFSWSTIIWILEQQNGMMNTLGDLDNPHP